MLKRESERKNLGQAANLDDHANVLWKLADGKRKTIGALQIPFDYECDTWMMSDDKNTNGWWFRSFKANINKGWQYLKGFEIILKNGWEVIACMYIKLVIVPYDGCAWQVAYFRRKCIQNISEKLTEL